MFLCVDAFTRGDRIRVCNHHDFTNFHELRYTHQAAAINAARRGEHVMLCTSTSSGKSLVYNTAVIDDVLTRPRAVALYIFPTKALAQDQVNAHHDAQ